MSNDILQVNCDSCGESALEPYIECCDCATNLCTSCFSSGQEVGTHSNDHRYAVRNNDFPLFDNCNWSAKEECKLLSALSTYGYGNWEEIARIVSTRSKLECQEHYKKYYIDNVQFKELNVLPETDQSMFPKPIVPYLYSMEVNQDPPRNNQSDPHLAGYNAYRSEFELSYDHNAESIFNIENDYSDEDNDDDEDKSCMDALKVSLVSALNTRLKERQRRYKVIQNHGLIIINKLMSWMLRFDKTITRTKTEKLLPFMQFMTGMQFDAFMESLHLESELIQQISRFIEYRRMGIKSLYGIKLYQCVKQKHLAIMEQQKSATLTMSLKFSNLHEKTESQKFKINFAKDGQMKCRRSTVPLEIADLPGFHLLSAVERILCSNLRLLPLNYLEIKEQLVSENNKLGALRLLDARKIVKIDVNKTRKIYDHLAEEGFIKIYTHPVSTVFNK